MNVAAGAEGWDSDPREDGGRENASPGDITSLLGRAAAGDKSAEEQLWERTYDELKRIARRSLRGERAGVPMQPTELVNSLFLRLTSSGPVQWKDRRSFYLVASLVIRHILVDLARHSSRKKRGEAVGPSEFQDWMAMVESNAEQVLCIEQALESLAKESPNGKRLEKVVTLRFFAGFREQEIAALLGVSERTVKRDWVVARNYLAAYFQQ